MDRGNIGTFDRIAAPYDRAMAPLETLWLRRMRSSLVTHMQGRVLEIGVGTGANLPYYHPSICLSAVDESADMLLFAAGKADGLGRCVLLSQASAERLPFLSGSFDTAIASLVLCSVRDQRQSLRELWRVLCQPGGRLLLLEHMRPSLRPLARLVELANVPWVALNGRCHLNRDTLQATVETGFEIERVEARIGGLLRLIVANTV